VNVKASKAAASKAQLTLDFEPGLVERHRSLRDCIATSIYRRGLSTVAIELNESPGNLTNQLSDDSPRKFGVDEFERHLEKSKDYTSIYYLIEKFLHKPDIEQDAALAQLLPLLSQLAPVMRKAGLL
jgi:hypothetical protein